MGEHDDWNSICLATPDGEQVFNTLQIPGVKPPNLMATPFFREAMVTGKPIVSGYRVGLLSKKPVISLAVPVRWRGKLTYALAGSISVDAFTRLLESQDIPSDWTAAILDQDGVLIARSHSAEQFVGSPATSSLGGRVRMKEPEGDIQEPNKEGQATYGAFSRSRLTGWTVVLGVPSEIVTGPVRRVLWLVSCGGLLLLTAGIWMAIVIGRRITRPIIALEAAALALGRGEIPSPVSSGVPEVRAVSMAIERAARERMSAEEELKRALRHRDDFLSIASHELKTPLTSIHLQTQLARRQLSPNPESGDERGVEPARVRRLVDHTERGLQRLTRLVDDMLDVSRIATGKLSLRRELCDLGDIVRDSLSQMSDQLRVARIEVRLSLEEGLKGAWDADRLEQVMTNLISNAIRYSPGAPLELSLKKSGSQAVLNLRDHGPGIPKSIQDRIFQRFERGVGEAAPSGLGLGLYISREIVERHGGSLRVRSEEGQGADFVMELPLQA